MLFGSYDLHPFIDEGLATCFGGLRGESFSSIVAEVARSVSEKDLALEEVIDRRGISSRTYYVGGAVFMKAVEDQRGTEGITAFLEQAATEAGILHAVRVVLGVDPEDLSELWRAKLREDAGT